MVDKINNPDLSLLKPEVQGALVELEKWSDASLAFALEDTRKEMGGEFRNIVSEMSREELLSSLIDIGKYYYSDDYDTFIKDLKDDYGEEPEKNYSDVEKSRKKTYQDKKVTSADKKFDSTETVLSDALSHCKDWLKVMTGLTEAALTLQTVANKALPSTTHSKAFVDIIGMTNKESDLFAATKALFTTISSYAKLAKSGSIAQQVLEYVFSNVEAYGGIDRLNGYLAQLEADKDRLLLVFPVGSPGKPDSLVELTVTKSKGNSPFSVKRTKMLGDVIDLMGTYVEDAGRKYKEAVTNILNLNNFLITVNEYASLKKPEDRDRVEQQLMQNPLWEKFESLVTFPEAKDSYKYNMEVKDPDMQVAGFMLRAGKVIQAAFAEAVDSMLQVDSVLETLCLGELEVSSEAIEGIEESSIEEEEEESGFGYDLALAASFRRKAVDISSEVSTEEILRARQLLEEAGISEEIIFLLPSVPEVTALNHITARRRVSQCTTLVKAYATEFDSLSKQEKSLVPLKRQFLKDMSLMGVSASKMGVLSKKTSKEVYAHCIDAEAFIADTFNVSSSHKVCAALSDEPTDSVRMGEWDVDVRKSLNINIYLYQAGWDSDQVAEVAKEIPNKFPGTWASGGYFGILSLEVAGPDPEKTVSAIFSYLVEISPERSKADHPGGFGIGV